MATYTIPEKSITQCDGCRQKCDNSIRFLRKMQAVISINATGLDWVGDPVCSNNRTIELCDSCFTQLYKKIEEHIQTLQSGINL